MLTRIKQAIHRFRVRKACIFEKNTTIDSHCRFEGKNRIGANTAVLNSRMGYGTYISGGSFIKNAAIGRYCCIAPDVVTVSGSHPTQGFASIHPAFYSTRGQCGLSYVKENKFCDFRYLDAEKQVAVTIGSDVWIGQGARIMEGVSIGDGAVIAACAVVTHNVEPYSITGGVPARHIKYRFSEETREKLLALKWWEKEQTWISEHASKFDDVEKLLDSLEDN